MGARALALRCALLLLACARVYSYTVDCNHEYTDCDTELSKLTSDDEEVVPPKTSSLVPEILTEPETTTSPPPTRSTAKIREVTTVTTTEKITSAATEVIVKPKGRLLNLNVDELQNFANALHNQTRSLEKNPKKTIDLSDVNLDDDDEDFSKNGGEHKNNIPDKFYSNLQAPFHSNLQAPFHSLMTQDRGSEESETCKESGVIYKIGEHIDRGCEETCECMVGGTFECTARCKHPYIRRGRRLNDPLCFESPVDDCCSIVACATGNGGLKDMKGPKMDICRYGNETHQMGSTWNIGCEQICVCEPNSVVTCKPRCKPVHPSDKCINVQDPNDACCEVQVCDVSQDVHEEPTDNITTSTHKNSTGEITKDSEDNAGSSKSPMRPLVLTEPIGSVKVLHNNSVQVNLMHVNDSQDPIHLQLSSDGGKSFKDIELKYTNLILDLEGGKDYILKTKETGTKFNFTITASDTGANEVPNEDSVNTSKIGCYHNGQFYEVGEEFRIGCTELCECTGHDTRECAALVCPSHVGLELVSKGCVRWAPNPPPQPPNCCPRTARCLSDGTCHYKGNAVPNWSEVPISLTGCEQRCFCENGELDCQEVCSPLPAIPPQSLRCPPMHRPAPVNISDEDCCKTWGCLPNAVKNDASIPLTLIINQEKNYVTPISPLLQTISTVLPTSSVHTDSNSMEFYKNLNLIKSFPKFLKNTNPIHVSATFPKYTDRSLEHTTDDNITLFTLHDLDSPFKTVHPETPLVIPNENWKIQTQSPYKPILEALKKSHTSLNQATHSHLEKKVNILVHDKQPTTKSFHFTTNQETQDAAVPKIASLKTSHNTVRKIPISQVDMVNLFLPVRNKYLSADTHRLSPNTNMKATQHPHIKNDIELTTTATSFFIPANDNKSNDDYILSKHSNNSSHDKLKYVHHVTRGNQVTVLRNKDVKTVKLIDTAHQNHETWAEGVKHLLTKEPNPYETVLLRVLPSRDPDTANHGKTQLVASQKYSSLDLDRILSQMEVESEVNRNLGRSADKTMAVALKGGQSSDIPLHPQLPKQPPFLPTIPPEIHYSQDEIPDYDQNNIHHPGSSLEPNLPVLPPGLTIPPNYGEENKKLNVISLQADSPTSVKMLFGLPPVLVGLRGSVDLRYTDKPDEDITHWYSQVFAPVDEVLTTPRLEFRLTGLQPSTNYKIRGKLYLQNLPVEPESEIYSVRTQDLPTMPPIEEKRREIDSRLSVVDVNVTSAHVSWRHFTEEELQFIDGIQVRYRPVGTPIYSMTELLHHSRSAADLHDLRPGTRYEASLVLVPPPRSVTELHDPGRVEFTTSPYTDPYNWSVIVEARAVGSEAAELTWRGIPSPAERWVRVYRAAHACGPPAVSTRREHDAFRLATRDIPPSITITGLEPNNRCRVWLELFLTNGKVKTSNVLEINTKSPDSHEPIDNEIEASSIAGTRGAPHGDYYGALVVVGVVAALGALTSLLLLLVVVRRHRPRSVPITTVPTAPRESSLPPYDNPAYKLELQQETMDL